MAKNQSWWKNPKTLVTIVGVVLIPTLYNLIFLSSMWDPYGQLSELPVAVVNQDQSATYQEKEFAIGQDMVDNLAKNDDLDFHFVSQKAAQDGLKKGKYYMVVTLPKDMSKQATTLLTDHPQQVEIDYQTSKGHSFVASKMSESAMKELVESVSDTISTSYTKTVFEKVRDLQKGLVSAADGSKQLVDGTQQLQSGSNQLTGSLGQLATSNQVLHEGTQALDKGLTTYTQGVDQIKDGLGNLSTGLTAYTDGVSSLATGASTLTSHSASLVAGGQALQAGVTALSTLSDGLTRLQVGMGQLGNATTMTEEQKTQIAQLVAALPTLNTALQNLQATSVNARTIPTNLGTTLTQVATLAQSIVDASAADKTAMLTALQATTAYQSLSADQQAEMVSALQSAPSVTSEKATALLTTVQELSTVLTDLQSAVSQMRGVQTAITQVSTTANQVLPAAATTLSTISGGLDQVHQVTTAQLSPAVTALQTGADTLSKKLTAGVGQLNSGLSSYTAAVDRLSAGAVQLQGKNDTVLSGASRLTEGADRLTENTGSLLSGASQLDIATGQLVTGSGQLVAGSQALGKGLISLSEGTTTLNNSLSDASQRLSFVSVTEKNAESFVTPVASHHTDTDLVQNNGSGLAPYMMAVSLMVVALSTNVIFAKALSGSPYRTKAEWAKQKLLLNGGIATAASLVLFFAVRWLGVQMAHSQLSLLTLVLGAWVLMALVTALVSWDDRYGSFASLILLLLQLGASAGTYPIELSARFFQTIQPYLPMSYLVSALRETLSLSGVVNSQWLHLILFLLGFMGLGWFLFQPKNSQTI